MADGSIAVDEPGPTDRTSFIGMLVGFGDQLRAAGVPIGSGDLLTYCAAMALLDPGDVLDLYWAGRTSLVSRHDHIPIYDRVFRTYFLDHPDDLQEPARAVLKQSQIENQSVIEVPFAEPAQPGKEEEARLGLMASDIEIWRNKAFSACTDEELAALRRIMNQVKVIPPRRRSRRTTQSRAGSRPDLRRTVRTTMRTHGEPSELFWRQRRLKMRPLVLILDVSGSMADYSRNLLQFAYSTRRAATKVEVFCFGRGSPASHGPSSGDAPTTPWTRRRGRSSTGRAVPGSAMPSTLSSASGAQRDEPGSDRRHLLGRPRSW